MKEITLPITGDELNKLEVGQEVLLQGTMLVGRDQAHLRLFQAIQDNEPLPVNLAGEAIYYMGPAPTPSGEVIGSAGPTTAYRMDPFTPKLMEAGLKVMIGKGPRSEEVRQAILNNRGTYFYAYGGCGALYAQSILKVDLLAYDDLGPEAIYRIEVKDFPVIVAINTKGDSIY